MNEIYLLIATAGRSDLLARTLQSIADCEIPAGLVSVMVIENGKPCGSEEICAQRYGDLDVQYRWSPVPNKSHALNVAMEEIPDSALIIFSDDDIRFTSQTLVAYEAAARNAEPGQFFGGPFGCDYEVPPLPWVLPYLPLSAVGWQPSIESFDPRNERFLGFNWAAFCHDIKRLGGFDPNFGPGSPTGATGQETNMQRRMHASGMQGRLVQDAFVYHFVPRNRCSIDWTVQRAWRNGISRGYAHRDRSIVDIALSHWSNSFRLITSTATRLITSPLPSSQANFHARYRQQKALGYFKGFRSASADSTKRAA